jgi:hypothetical protein
MIVPWKKEGRRPAARAASLTQKGGRFKPGPAQTVPGA